MLAAERDRDDESKGRMGGGERRDLVVDQAGGPGRVDDVDVPKGRRLALPRHHPDRSVRPERAPQLAEPHQLVDRVRGEKDQVRVRLRSVDGNVVGALRERAAERLVLHADDRDAGTRLDTELVEERGRIDAFHRVSMLPRHNAAMVKRATDGPLLVYGPLSPTYDFGASHPLTPRRFGPGIDLLRAVGAEPRLVPEPARDDDLLLSHTAAYLAAVKRLSEEPSGPAEAGIGDGGDNPSFAGMHEAGAMVAGGSLRAVEAILRGDV